jgi:hypothetical protein
LELSLIAGYCDYSDIVWGWEICPFSHCTNYFDAGCVYWWSEINKLSSPFTGLDRPWALQEVEVSRFTDNQLVRLSVTSNGHLYPPWLISDPRAIVWPEGLSQWKISVTSKINTMTVRLAQCLNQLWHLLPQWNWYYTITATTIIIPVTVTVLIRVVQIVYVSWNFISYVLEKVSSGNGFLHKCLQWIKNLTLSFWCYQPLCSLENPEILLGIMLVLNVATTHLPDANSRYCHL